MANFTSIFQFEVVFLVLFAFVSALLMGVIGLVFASLSLALLLYVVYAHGKQKPQVEANNQTASTEQETEAESEDSELDDLLLLDPTNEDED